MTGYTNANGSPTAAGDDWDLVVKGTDGGGLSTPDCTARLKITAP